MKKLCDLLGIDDHEQLFSGSGLDDTPAGWAAKAAEVIRRNDSDSEWLKGQIDIAYRMDDARSVLKTIKDRGLYDAFKEVGKISNEEEGLGLIKYLLREGSEKSKRPLSPKEIIEKVEAFRSKQDDSDNSSR